jgi:hypothetical protein
MLVYAITEGSRDNQLPRAVRDALGRQKAPIGGINILQAQIIPDGRRNVQSCLPVFFIGRRAGSKDVIHVILAERAGVFPLGVGDLAVMADGYPAIFAPGINIIPGSQRAFGGRSFTLAFGVYIAIRQSEVKVFSLGGKPAGA